mgnify:CR=1 FL=1
MKSKILSLRTPWIEIALGITILAASLLVGFMAREFIVDLQTNLFIGDGREWGFF